LSFGKQRLDDEPARNLKGTIEFGILERTAIETEADGAGGRGPE
jgi:hypothetical protein